MATVEKADVNNFESLVIESGTPVLVDFWAEWCGPCRGLAPVLEEVAGEVDGRGSVVKVNVDENRELAQKYGIRGLPTLMFFKAGQVEKTLVGAQPKAEIIKSFEELV